MLYHLGQIISKHFGYAFVPVWEDAPVSNVVWSYERTRTVTVQAMRRQMTPSDILVCSPSASGHFLGRSFPGKKLMYLQGCTTYVILDAFFDKYVSVSTFVRDNMAQTYQIKTPVIPAFIHHEDRPEPLPAWTERPAGSVVVHDKHHEVFCEAFSSAVKGKYPGLEFSPTRIAPNTPHEQYLEILSRHRYLVNLYPVEGFGIPPLEAMLCGTAVAGFHNSGGDYFHPETGAGDGNALLCRYPDFDALAELFARLLSDDTLAQCLVANGQKTAQGYGFKQFEAAWLQELRPFLDGTYEDRSARTAGSPGGELETA